MTPPPNPFAPEARRAALAEPRLAAYLPLVYIAWADGDLAPAEIAGIRARLEAGAELPAACLDLLGAWLDPAAAPSAGELAALLASLQRDGQEWDPLESTCRHASLSIL